MSNSNDERLLQICKSVSEEKDTEKLATLITQLNDELANRRTKKPADSAKPEPASDPNAKRASQG